MDDKKNKCCKDFDESACPCLDKESGQRKCDPEQGCGNNKGGCNKDGGCGPKPSEP